MDFESKLSGFLSQYLSRADGKTPPVLAESIRYSLLAPGKRIRPRLTLACAEMLKVPEASALCAASAIEMIHCFTLIHDDLPCMDNDDFRRGRPSNHKQFGESTALLAGDSLLALAFDILASASATSASETVLKAIRRLAWASGPRGVIGGQAAEAELNEGSSIHDLRAMHAGKTGALFSAALLMPLDLSGLPEDSDKSKALQRFASELGLAFQIVDDLEDAEQDRQGSSFRRTSILAYQSEPQVRQETRAALQAAESGLRSHWQERADPLIRISNEVLRKLET